MNSNGHDRAQEQEERRCWPADVGIKAIEFVVPKLYVSQQELEAADGASAGKYTIGLGQEQMGFCSDREDINSLCLTALNALMERYALRYEDVGFVAVGTETVVDKSKSVKTVLMELFEASGNFEVAGLDLKNACYGGTAALLHALDWVESSAWDGRLAVVVAGDIAVYRPEDKAARATGGAGACAILVGPNAPIVADRGLRTSYMRNVNDFCKPDLTSEFPVVDGKESIKCYSKALDHCYTQYVDKRRRRRRLLQQHQARNDYDLTETFDAFIFHSPFCKLVQKSLARLVLNDYLYNAERRAIMEAEEPQLKSISLTRVVDNGRTTSSNRFETRVAVKLKSAAGDCEPAVEVDAATLSEMRDLTLDVEPAVEKLLVQCSRKTFERATKKSLLLARRVGNTYTASVFSCLVSHLAETPLDQLPGQRIGVFSYGSGLAASMYSLTVRRTGNGGDDDSQLGRMVDSARLLKERLDERVKVEPAAYKETLRVRVDGLHRVPFVPTASTDDLFPGTWYLERIDDKYVRHYARKQ